MTNNKKIVSCLRKNRYCTKNSTQFEFQTDIIQNKL